MVEGLAGDVELMHIYSLSLGSRKEGNPAVCFDKAIKYQLEDFDWQSDVFKKPSAAGKSKKSGASSRLPSGVVSAIVSQHSMVNCLTAHSSQDNVATLSVCRSHSSNSFRRKAKSREKMFPYRLSVRVFPWFF